MVMFLILSEVKDRVYVILHAQNVITNSYSNHSETQEEINNKAVF